MNIKLVICKYCNKPVGLNGHNCPSRASAINKIETMRRLKMIRNSLLYSS